MSDLITAVILGIVEGITEFLPISSTGHLIIVQHLLGFVDERADTFAIFIQFGAMLAVIILYFRRFLDLLRVNGREGFVGLRALALLAVTVLPAGLIGFFLSDLIFDRLFSPYTVAVGLGIGGLAIILAEERSPIPHIHTLDELTFKQAALIGLFQCLALWPGVSRAAATILGGMMVGLKREAAAEYSFLAAVPILSIAAFYSLYKNLDLLSPSDIPMFAIGLIVSMLAALAAIRWLIGMISTGTFKPFGWYRMVLAVVVILYFSLAG